MLLPKLFISSSVSVVLYLWLKSKLDIFFAIEFNSNIGSVNFLVTYDTITAAINIAKPAIKYKKLLDIFTLSWIEFIGILIYNKYPLSSVAASKIYVSPFLVSFILLITKSLFSSIISPSPVLNLLVISFICPNVEKKSLFDVYTFTFWSSLINISKLFLIAIFSNSVAKSPFSLLL